MRQLMLLRILVLLLGIVALFMVPALGLAIAGGDLPMVKAFALPMGIALILAAPAAVFTRKFPSRLSARDGFLLVFLIWVFSSLMGALPYYLSGQGITFTDAVFESTCGFATTGATTINDVEVLPQPLLLWRSMTHWFGGMGIVMLTVALVPLLGVGGFQLLKAETPGPEKEKITPKVTATAKILWLVYMVLTAVLTVLFALGGMEWFDALCHAFTTMASGGISTKNSGIAYYDSTFIETVCVLFMLLAGLNFNLYYKLFKGKFREIRENTEGRVYLFIFLAATVILTVSLVPVYGSAGSALRYGAYQAASILTTTGSSTADYMQWPGLAKGILLCLMFVGGCSGSTAGGIKVIRHAVLFKQAGNELRRIIYPRGIFSITLNKKVGRRDVVYGVAGFFFLYMAVIAVTALIVAASGTDVVSSFSAALAMVSNVGLGFGTVGPGQTYAAFPNHIKWLFSFVMIAGRLELWTVFVLFTPEYWRR
ncbi:TrkH family potassium uptake protein [Breznakiella homolactica]|uniref:TrkH family potassium uptake protein n=1 Tax=Breznakiella homolactica TaxID=2798577 RepID=A0A7T8B9G4_9SPIR|nr:TrkH family potassium uptake protein [Breznakiella homolactica]QQO09604.1 TrkH family potassium uptake protein [Breznakiella homolactica]